MAISDFVILMIWVDCFGIWVVLCLVLFITSVWNFKLVISGFGGFVGLMFWVYGVIFGLLWDGNFVVFGFCVIF